MRPRATRNSIARSPLASNFIDTAEIYAIPAQG